MKKHLAFIAFALALAIPAAAQKSPNIIDSSGGLSYRANTRTVTTAYTVKDEDHTVLGTLDTVVAVKATTGTTLPTSTVTEASGDGSKKLTIYLDK